MKNLMRWLHAIWRWLTEAWHAWLAMGVVAIALLGVQLADRTEPAFRVAGMALQLFGVATVAWGIAKTRSQFGHPSFLSTLVRWVLRFPPYKLPAIRGAMHATAAPATMQGYGTVSPPEPKDKSLDARVGYLEEGQRHLRTELANLHRLLDEQANKSTGLILQEASERSRAVANILARLETTATGGVHIAAIGAVWLFVGVVLGTSSPELAAAFK